MGNKTFLVFLFFVFCILAVFVMNMQSYLEREQVAPTTAPQATLAAIELEQKISMMKFSFTIRKVLQGGFVIFLAGVGAGLIKLLWSIGKKPQSDQTAESVVTMKPRPPSSPHGRVDSKYGRLPSNLAIEISDKIEEEILDKGL